MQHQRYNEEQQSRFIQEYKVRRARLTYAWTHFTFGAVIGLPSLIVKVETFHGFSLLPIRVGALLLMFIGIGIFAINWRCPGCSKFITELDKEYCSGCGARFRDN